MIIVSHLNLHGERFSSAYPNNQRLVHLKSITQPWNSSSYLIYPRSKHLLEIINSLDDIGLIESQH